VVGLPLDTPPAEVRLNREDRRLAAVSLATILCMYEYGLALEEHLKWHEGNLRWRADDEADLYEAMGLSSRLANVERNISRVDGRNERLRGELLRREIDGEEHE